MTFKRKMDPAHVLEVVQSAPNGSMWVATLRQQLGVHPRTLNTYLNELEAAGSVELGYSRDLRGRPGWVAATTEQCHHCEGTGEDKGGPYMDECGKCDGAGEVSKKHIVLP